MASTTSFSLESILDLSRKSSISLMSPATVGFIALVLIWALYKSATQTQVPSIPSIPTAPSSLPFVGHLLSLGGRLSQNDSTIYSQWSTAVNSPIFQLRLGSERAIIANTFAVIKDLWIGHSQDLINKPQQHGFAELLEYDLSGANMTEPIRRCRKAAMRALGKPLWGSYYHLLEPSSVVLTRELLASEGRHVDVYLYLRGIVFDLVMSLTYGTVSTGVDDAFTDGLIESINTISAYRASTQRLRDYVPILRFLIPSFAAGNEVAAAEKRRQKYLDVVYGALKERIAKGEKVDCIVNGLVKDNLSEGEIHGTCKALLQAAPDSTASSVYVAIGWMSSPDGQEFQTELYEAILAVYGGDRDRAWDMAFREESVELLVSLYKETLRFWTTTPFAVPRTTVADIAYMGTVIPTGTTMIMNAQQANHDIAWYGEDAMEFKPTRFLSNTTSLPHLTFGAGSRICPAAALSNRIIYALLARIVLAFKIKESSDPGARKPNSDMLGFSAEYRSLVALPDRFDCCFEARDENWVKTKLVV